MKERRFLLCLGILAVVGILTFFIGYAMDTHLVHTSNRQFPVETTTLVGKKEKSCGCCKESMKLLKEQIRKARERRQVARQAEKTQQMP